MGAEWVSLVKKAPRYTAPGARLGYVHAQ